MAPAEIKAALAMALGSNAQTYWRNLSDFLQGKMSRAEFEDLMQEKLDTPQLSKYHFHTLKPYLIFFAYRAIT